MILLQVSFGAMAAVMLMHGLLAVGFMVCGNNHFKNCKNFVVILICLMMPSSLNMLTKLFEIY